LDGRTDGKRENAGDALAERLVPNGIVSIDLDSGNAPMETEFPQSQFAGRRSGLTTTPTIRQKMFGDLSQENVS
jgi:hypothetical protein